MQSSDFKDGLDKIKTQILSETSAHSNQPNPPQGYWNPFQLCDVEFTAAARGGVERVNAKCKSGACTADFVGNMPFAQTCDALYLTQVLRFFQCKHS